LKAVIPSVGEINKMPYDSAEKKAYISPTKSEMKHYDIFDVLCGLLEPVRSRICSLEDVIL
jgi:hypothetical protein